MSDVKRNQDTLQYRICLVTPSNITNVYSATNTYDSITIKLETKNSNSATVTKIKLHRQPS